VGFVFKAFRRKTYYVFLLLLWLAISVVASVAGPFGTYEFMQTGDRFFYWFTVVAISIVVARFIRLNVERRMPEPRALATDLVTLALIIPALTTVLMLVSPFMPGMWTHEFPNPLVIAAYVAMVGVVVTLFRRAVHFTDEDAAPVVVPRLSERLPEDRRGTILRLSSCDHMVEVASTRGTSTIRIRLVDAIREMEPVEGYCTHRSHWVARAAVASVEHCGGGKVALKLVNGDEVPVSRKYRPGLEEAGVI
jgi:DNA-binding LytR/AlgR family response regulator